MFKMLWLRQGPGKMALLEGLRPSHTQIPWALNFGLSALEARIR